MVSGIKFAYGDNWSLCKWTCVPWSASKPAIQLSRQVYTIQPLTSKKQNSQVFSPQDQTCELSKILTQHRSYCLLHMTESCRTLICVIKNSSLAAHSSVLSWRIPWTEEPGGLWSIGWQSIRHDLSDLAHTHTHILYTQSEFSNHSKLGVPNLWGLMPGDVRWACCNNNRNKMHSKCDALESLGSRPPAPWKNGLPWNWSLLPTKTQDCYRAFFPSFLSFLH